MALDQQELGKILVQKGLINEKNLATLIKKSEQEDIALETLLFEKEVMPDEKLGAVMAEMYGHPFVKVADMTIPESVLRVVPYQLASRQLVIPFEQNGNRLKVAVSDPQNYELVNFLEKKTGMIVDAYFATKKDIKLSLKAFNRNVNEQFNKFLKQSLISSTDLETLSDATKLLDTIILFAFQNGASDIHLEPHGNFMIVRYRVDGMLRIVAELPITLLEMITSRIKVLANMRTDEHRAPQDGRFKIDLEKNEITLRVSIVPTYDGEKTVMRLLTSSNQELNLESLGYSKQNLKLIHDNILKTHGIILMTGPTGSGKTTTLYSVLKLLNAPEVNIATIEDPIEYKLEGVNQIQVNPKVNLTFATGLRALLRQDPNVIMVGEIRDQETGDIAINAALTGHLVLATLHTNDAATTLPRLTEMGIQNFLVGATVQMVMAQRLVRTICPKCKSSYEISGEELQTLGEKFSYKQDFSSIFNSFRSGDEGLARDGKVTFYKGQGCGNCGGSGYKGRASIAEVMEVSNELRKLILRNASPKEIEDQAVKEGMTTLFLDGMRKVSDGITTIEEVLRVMRS
jgi:type IV pilus assembly protein PilB